MDPNPNQNDYNDPASNNFAQKIKAPYDYQQVNTVLEAFIKQQKSATQKGLVQQLQVLVCLVGQPVSDKEKQWLISFLQNYFLKVAKGDDRFEAIVGRLKNIANSYRFPQQTEMTEDATSKAEQYYDYYFNLIQAYFSKKDKANSQTLNSKQKHFHVLCILLLAYNKQFSAVIKKLKADTESNDWKQMENSFFHLAKIIETVAYIDISKVKDFFVFKTKSDSKSYVSLAEKFAIFSVLEPDCFYKKASEYLRNNNIQKNDEIAKDLALPIKSSIETNYYITPLIYLKKFLINDKNLWGDNNINNNESISPIVHSELENYELFKNTVAYLLDWLLQYLEEKARDASSVTASEKIKIFNNILDILNESSDKITITANISQIVNSGVMLHSSKFKLMLGVLEAYIDSVDIATVKQQVQLFLNSLRKVKESIVVNYLIAKRDLADENIDQKLYIAFEEVILYFKQQIASNYGYVSPACEKRMQDFTLLLEELFLKKNISYYLTIINNHVKMWEKTDSEKYINYLKQIQQAIEILEMNESLKEGEVLKIKETAGKVQDEIKELSPKAKVTHKLFKKQVSLDVNIAKKLFAVINIQADRMQSPEREFFKRLGRVLVYFTWHIARWKGLVTDDCEIRIKDFAKLYLKLTTSDSSLADILSGHVDNWPVSVLDKTHMYKDRLNELLDKSKACTNQQLKNTVKIFANFLESLPNNKELSAIEIKAVAKLQAKIQEEASYSPSDDYYSPAGYGVI